MPKKPAKIIIKFSNDSTTKVKQRKGKPKKSGPSEGDKNGDSKPPRKLRP